MNNINTISTESTEQLKPCPFCGCNKPELEEKIITDYKIKAYCVVCFLCSSSTAFHISEEDAAELKSKFSVSVKNVNRLEEADLNQEFFDKIFGADAVKDEAGFTAKITEEIESMFKQDADRKLQNDIYTQFTEQTKM